MNDTESIIGTKIVAKIRYVDYRILTHYTYLNYLYHEMKITSQ